jgi:trimethylamine--corrinoid protein Co-methyltransferase
MNLYESSYAGELDGLSLGMLSKEDVRHITQATFDVLENVGIGISDPEALALYDRAGCDVDYELGVVKIPEYVVTDALRFAPSRVRFAAIDKKKDVIVEAGGAVNWAPFGVGIQSFEYDVNGKHTVRPSTKEDLKKSMTICDWCDSYNVADPTVSAVDIVGKGRRNDLHELAVALSNTTKPFTYGEPDPDGFDDYFELTKMVYGGDEELAIKRPLINMCYCPTSPLEICDVGSQIAIKSARHNIPNCVLSMAMAGGTGPITLEGTLVVQNAEVLAGIALAQIVNKGAPVTYGCSTTIMDQRRGTAAVGAPEMALISAAAAQLCEYYNIPCTDIAGS